MIPDASWPSGREAPGRLERVRRFVNTVNRENGADHFGEPLRAARWLAGDGWALAPSADELVELRRFRADLHGAIARRTRAGPSWPSATADVRLGVAAGADGVTLVGTGERAKLIVSELVAILVEAELAGTLTRLRTCTNEHCQWSYYDRSKNAGGQWCAMSACGQRQKMRRYRARQRAGADR
jgi:predicted RNA-binding Zn ribbon-like protein